jgi:hypothetical protein
MRLMCWLIGQLFLWQLNFGFCLIRINRAAIEWKKAVTGAEGLGRMQK